MPGTALTSSGCSDSGSYRKQIPLTPAVLERRIDGFGTACAVSRAEGCEGCEGCDGAGLSLHASPCSRAREPLPEPPPPAQLNGAATQCRLSVGVGKFSFLKTCPRWPLHVWHTISIREPSGSGFSSMAPGTPS